MAKKQSSLAEDLQPRIREIRFSLHLLKQNPLVILGFAITALMMFTAVFAPWIAPYGAEERFWQANLQPPSWQHLFGTDEIGGDIFSRVVWATRVDLGLALLVVIGIEVTAVLVGSISGYLGGKVDEVLMRITDMLLAFPGLILAMAVAAALGRNLTNLAIALMIVGWPGDARLIRGVILGERSKLYVEAARSVGAGRPRIIFLHVLPNAIYPLLVSATLDLGGTILAFAGLSFLGFGAGSGAAEWGYMISLGRNYLYASPWVATFPGLAIFFTVMGFNLVGDGLRDVLDPRLRR
ncbi:MAG: ABC transporter permease [Candidatus Bathyarchaeia archaeon]|jgi:peptide/nickel transport system permease protein